MLLPQKNHIFLAFTLLFILSLLFVSNSIAEDTNSSSSKYLISQNYIIAGVHYLINQQDLDKAEEQFQKSILSSPMDSFSSIPNNANQTMAESFYFLGKIYYDRAKKSGEIKQNIGKAKFYLAKADEYGITYFRINPRLLDEINRIYPNIPVIIPEISQNKAKITIETQDQSYKLDSIRIDHSLNITKDKFSTNRKLELQDNSRYKIQPDYKSSYKSIYGALVIFGMVMMVLLARG